MNFMLLPPLHLPLLRRLHRLRRLPSPSSRLISDNKYGGDELRRVLFFPNHLQLRDRDRFQAKRHFVNGAQLLSQAKSSNSLTLARSAESEADAAVRLDPTDAASHILKALALEFQGFKTSALDSIDVALSPLAAKSLSGEERGDALVKRAELKVEMSRQEKSVGGGLLDQAVEEDLVEALKLRPDNARAWCLLGDCYEAKEMKEKAIETYEAALKAQPECKPATDALLRLGS